MYMYVRRFIGYIVMYTSAHDFPSAAGWIPFSDYLTWLININGTIGKIATKYACVSFNLAYCMLLYKYYLYHWDINVIIYVYTNDIKIIIIILW